MMQIPLGHILVLSSLLFSIGVLGVLLRRNAIVIFMSIELMLNAVNLSFVGFAQSMNSLNGVMFIFFIIEIIGTIKSFRHIPTSLILWK